jgi:hypothetical protein
MLTQRLVKVFLMAHQAGPEKVFYGSIVAIDVGATLAYRPRALKRAKPQLLVFHLLFRNSRAQKIRHDSVTKI